jgi:hypothetical protein
MGRKIKKARFFITLPDIFGFDRGSCPCYDMAKLTIEEHF